MRNARLLEPISEEAPSGPDLDETADEAYGEYTMLAGARLPERFFSKEASGSDREVPFDRSRIDIAAETEQIDSLLRRTRDLRLLVLAARFYALHGDFSGFADSLEDIAAVLDRFWDSVHPLPQDDDLSARTNTLDELESQVHVVLPLTYAPLVGSGGAAVSYRSYLLSTDKARPRDGEEVPSLDRVLEGLSSLRNTEQVERSLAAVNAAIAALAAIRSTYLSHGCYTAPGFGRTLKLLGELKALLEQVRPDLSANGSPPVTDTGEQAGSEPSTTAAPDARVTVGPVAIASSTAAAAALLAAEQYFQRNEPSAPALILLHQARMLYGKPLVAALEALLPNSAATAALRFDGDMGFDISLDQMRAVTDDVMSASPASDEENDWSEASDVVFLATSRSEATSLMLGIETFYRQAEPSSPIPVLLSKARSMLNKDFAAVLGELLPRAQ